MRPRESALVAFLSSSYQPRNPVAVATRGCAGGLGGLSWVVLGWVGLGCPKIADVEEMAGFDRAVVFA